MKEGWNIRGWISVFEKRRRQGIFCLKVPLKSRRGNLPLGWESFSDPNNLYRRFYDSNEDLEKIEVDAAHVGGAISFETNKRGTFSKKLTSRNDARYSELFAALGSNTPQVCASTSKRNVTARRSSDADANSSAIQKLMPHSTQRICTTILRISTSCKFHPRSHATGGRDNSERLSAVSLSCREQWGPKGAGKFYGEQSRELPWPSLASRFTRNRPSCSDSCRNRLRAGVRRQRGGCWQTVQRIPSRFRETLLRER